MVQDVSDNTEEGGRDAAAAGAGLGLRTAWGRFWQRLYLRRWLVGVAAATIAAFVVTQGLPIWAGLAGLAVIAAGSGLLPREGVLKVAPPLPARKGRGSRALIKRLIEGLPEPAIILSARGTVLAANGSAAELAPSLRIDQHISAALRNPHVLDAVAGAGSGARARQTVRYTERVPVERHMEVTVAWIGDGPGKPQAPAILLFLRDLTEQDRLAQMRADFIANASHELRTPLASVLGFIDTLQGPARNDEAARDRFLAIMASQAERMARLINNLLSLSRVEMRAHLRPQTPVDMREVIDHVVTALEPLAAERSIALAVDAPAGRAVVLGDRDELVQVFQNLIHNALKYGHDGGQVTVRITRQPPAGRNGGMIAVAVEDDGPGIAADHLPRLTERFYRVHEGPPGDRNGTGLGLAIVKHVVNRHRGELRIASVVGKGSVFTVILAEAGTVEGGAVRRGKR